MVEITIDLNEEDTSNGYSTMREHGVSIHQALIKFLKLYGMALVVCIRGGGSRPFKMAWQMTNVSINSTYKFKDASNNT